MSREHDLIATFVELANAAEYAEADLIAVMTRRCAELTGWSAVAALLGGQGGTLELAAVSPRDSPVVELLDGPGNTEPLTGSFHSGSTVEIDLTATPADGSALETGAAQAGFTSIHVRPLRSPTEVIGSLCLFGAGAGAIREDDPDLAAALAEVTTLSILRLRKLEQAELVARQLQGALDSRVVIEQAKGILAATNSDAGFDMQEAFNALRAYARSNRIQLAAAARAVINGTIPTDVVLAGRLNPTRDRDPRHHEGRP